MVSNEIISASTPTERNARKWSVSQDYNVSLAAKSKDSPEHILLDIVRNAPQAVALVVAANPTASEKVLQELLDKYDNWNMTEAVLVNRNAPEDIVLKIMEDAHYLPTSNLIRILANPNLSKRFVSNYLPMPSTFHSKPHGKDTPVTLMAINHPSIDPVTAIHSCLFLKEEANRERVLAKRKKQLRSHLEETYKMDLSAIPDDTLIQFA